MPQPLPPSHDAPAAARAEALLALAPALYRTARRLTRRQEDAAAVTLEAVAVLQAADMQGGPETSRAAAFGALWRATEHRWRQQAYVPHVPLSASPEQILGERLDGEEADLDRLLISRLDASPEVDMALRELSERERFALLLVDVEDSTREEVAEALACGVQDVAELLLAGRVRLFASLADYAQRASGRHRLGGL